MTGEDAPFLEDEEEQIPPAKLLKVIGLRGTVLSWTMGVFGAYAVGFGAWMLTLDDTNWLWGLSARGWGTIFASFGAALFLVLIITARVAKARFNESDVRVTRDIDDEVLYRGRAFTVRIDSRQTRVHPRVFMTMEDVPGEGFVRLQEPEIRGLSSTEYRLRPRNRGIEHFRGVRTKFHDKMGFWTQTRLYKVQTEVEILSASPATEMRYRLDGYANLLDNTPKPMKVLFRDLEEETVRDFQPGDRMRDVDWKRLGITGHMITRQIHREPDANVVCMLDFSRKMMDEVDGVSNAAHMVDLAIEVTDSAIRRNHNVGFAAFDGHDILDYERMNRRKNFPKIAEERLTALYAKMRKEHEAWSKDKKRSYDLPEEDVLFRSNLRQALVSSNKTYFMVFTDFRQMPISVKNMLSNLARRGSPVIFLQFPTQLIGAADGSNQPPEEDALNTRILFETYGANVYELQPMERFAEGEEPQPLKAPMPRARPERRRPEERAPVFNEVIVEESGATTFEPDALDEPEDDF